MSMIDYVRDCGVVKIELDFNKKFLNFTQPNGEYHFCSMNKEQVDQLVTNLRVVQNEMVE